MKSVRFVVWTNLLSYTQFLAGGGGEGSSSSDEELEPSDGSDEDSGTPQRGGKRTPAKRKVWLSLMLDMFSNEGDLSRWVMAEATPRVSRAHLLCVEQVPVCCHRARRLLLRSQPRRAAPAPAARQRSQSHRRPAPSRAALQR